MPVDPMHDYRAYLFALEAAENFVLAYARANISDLDAAFSRERGLEEFRKMAVHLGFELVPVEAKKEAA
jgi:hypothetical protein